MDLSALSDAELMKLAGVPALGQISSAILGQESGNRSDIPASINGAIGPGQIMPSTFAQYAKPGEDINNPEDNRAVHGRILADLSAKAGGDPARIAVGYFSGPGNIAPADSPTPWLNDRKDGNGKSVSSYVSDVLGRMGNLIIPQAHAEDLSSMSDEQLQRIANQSSDDPSGLGSRPWSDLSIPASPLGQIQQPEAGKPSALQDIKDVLLYNTLPNLPLSIFGTLSYPLEIAHRAADYLGKDAADAVRSLLGMKPEPEIPYKPFIITPDKMTSDIADAIGKPLYHGQTALGRITESAGLMAPFAALGAAAGSPLAALLSLVGASAAPEVVHQLGGGEQAQFWSGLAGGLLGEKAAPKTISEPVPEIGTRGKVLTSAVPETAADMHALAGNSFKTADELGANKSADWTNNFIDEAGKLGKQTLAGKITQGENDVTQLLERWKALRDKPLSLADAQEMDQALGEMATSHYTVKGMDAIGKQLVDIQHKFRDMLFDNSNVNGGQAGLEAWRQGQVYWQQMMKMRDMEQIQDRASMTQNPVTSIRTQLKNMLTNKAKMRGWSADEIAAARAAQKSGALTNLLTMFGSRLAPIMSSAAGGATGGLAGAFVAGAVHHALSTTAREAANTIQMSKLQNVTKTIARNTTRTRRK